MQPSCHNQSDHSASSNLPLPYPATYVHVKALSDQVRILTSLMFELCSRSGIDVDNHFAASQKLHTLFDAWGLSGYSKDPSSYLAYSQHQDIYKFSKLHTFPLNANPVAAPPGPLPFQPQHPSPPLPESIAAPSNNMSQPPIFQNNSSLPDADQLPDISCVGNFLHHSSPFPFHPSVTLSQSTTSLQSRDTNESDVETISNAPRRPRSRHGSTEDGNTHDHDDDDDDDDDDEVILNTIDDDDDDDDEPIIMRPTRSRQPASRGGKKSALRQFRATTVTGTSSGTVPILRRRPTLTLSAPKQSTSSPAAASSSVGGASSGSTNTAAVAPKLPLLKTSLPLKRHLKPGIFTPNTSSPSRSNPPMNSNSPSLPSLVGGTGGSSHSLLHSTPSSSLASNVGPVIPLTSSSNNQDVPSIQFNRELLSSVAHAQIAKHHNDAAFSATQPRITSPQFRVSSPRLTPISLQTDLSATIRSSSRSKQQQQQQQQSQQQQNQVPPSQFLELSHPAQTPTSSATGGDRGVSPKLKIKRFRGKNSTTLATGQQLISLSSLQPQPSASSPASSSLPNGGTNNAAAPNANFSPTNSTGNNDSSSPHKITASSSQRKPLTLTNDRDAAAQLSNHSSATPTANDSSSTTAATTTTPLSASFLQLKPTIGQNPIKIRRKSLQRPNPTSSPK